jgi:ribosomal protein S18 acetylase RimI-like enzyme
MHPPAIPVISPATDPERNWAALLLAGSEPWIRLGATPEQCNKACHDSEYLLFIAHFNEQPCGIILMHPRGVASSPYVKSIAVDARFRSQGVGAALIDFAENWFRKDAKHMFLCVSSFNTRARIFYERLGYEAVGEFKDYIIPGASEILMHKRI